MSVNNNFCITVQYQKYLEAKELYPGSSRCRSTFGNFNLAIMDKPKPRPRKVKDKPRATSTCLFEFDNESKTWPKCKVCAECQFRRVWVGLWEK